MRTIRLRLCLLLSAVAFVATTSVHADIAPTDQENKFLKAVADGDIEAVKAALAAGVDVNASAKYGGTALHAAAERSRVAVLKLLIAAGADVNSREYLKSTPLHRAALRGPIEAVQALIEAGVDVNADAIPDSPLGAAAGAGNIEIARLLITSGADVNGGKVLTPLMLAAQYARVGMIELLVESGAIVNTSPHPPLHWAGKPEAAAALIKAGANVNIRDSEGRTALHRQHSDYKVDAVQILIAAGADVNARSKTGRTPLHEAIASRRLGKVKTLIQAHADVDARDDNGNTPLSLAQEAEELGKPLVELLVAAGARDDGLTELQRAAQDGDLDRVRALIAKTVDVNERGPHQITAVHVASEGGHTDILEALIQADAKVDTQDEQGRTPLHNAANAAVAELLIETGAQVTPPASAKSHQTPLYTAVAGGRADVVSVLVAHGASIDGQGMMPGVLIWAAYFGHVDIVKTLLDNGAKTESEGSLFFGTALHVAASGAFSDMTSPDDVTPDERLKIAKLLVTNGADVNAAAKVGYFDGFTPLHGAAFSGHAGIAEFLMEHGANINATSPTGMFVGFTPLHGAAKGGHSDVVSLLLKSGAKVNAKTGEKYFDGVLTPLDMANTPEVRALLVEHGGVSAAE